MLAKTGLTVKHDEKTGSMAIFAAPRANDPPRAASETSTPAKKKPQDQQTLNPP